MNNIAIKAENLSKAYQLGNIGTGTISRDMERWWAKLRGKEDPFLKIGEVNEVCFVEGMVFFKNKWFLYYGTADSKIGVAIAEK